MRKYAALTEFGQKLEKVSSHTWTRVVEHSPAAICKGVMPSWSAQLAFAPRQSKVTMHCILFLNTWKCDHYVLEWPDNVADIPL